MNPYRFLSTTTLLLASAVALTACGGGGGGGDDAGPVGSAALMITDATHADLEEVSITIDSITLSGTNADGPVSFTVDNIDPSLNLRQLVTTSHLLDLIQGIPVGEYTEVAIHITKVVVDDDDDDQPAATLTVEKTITLDLNGDPIIINDGATTTITLDFDLALSLLWDEAQQRWTWETRAFVHHGDDDGHKEVDEVHGTIAAPADLVCDPAMESLSLTLVTRETGREIPVMVDTNTEIENQRAASDDAEDLDVAGLCTLLADLADGDTLRVEVQGAFADDVLTASKLEIRDPNQVEMKGVITALTDPTGAPIVLAASVKAELDCSADYGSMTVRDRFDTEETFLFAAGHLVRFKDADTCGALSDAMAAQSTVKVTGTRQENETILLDRVKFEKAEDQEERERHDQRHRPVHGTAASAPDAAGMLIVQTRDGDVTVQVDDHDKVIQTGGSNAHHMATTDQIVEGSCLQLSGEVQDDGSVEAKNIVILPETACQ